ncbi:hypothetical protein D3C78_1480490 [compost metagenome]
MRVCSRCFSSLVSQLALEIRSLRQKITRMPTAIEGSPSRKNSHCQPANPWSPLKALMIQPDRGAPISPDSGTAVANRAYILPRRWVGNQ